jgi:hypothetical protein
MHSTSFESSPSSVTVRDSPAGARPLSRSRGPRQQPVKARPARPCSPPRTRLRLRVREPGPGPRFPLPAWAKRGPMKCSSKSTVRSRSTAERAFQPNKIPRAVLPQNPSSFLSSLPRCLLLPTHASESEATAGGSERAAPRRAPTPARASTAR